MDYEVILFDADGTIFDFARAEAYALENTFCELGLPFGEEEVKTYHRVNHEAWRMFERGVITSIELRTLRFERFVSARGLSADPETMSSTYLSWLAQAAFLIDGAEGVIERLSGNVKMAIVTNGLKDVQNGRFRRSPITDRFEAVVISEEVGVQKPDPAIFDRALAALGHADRRSVLMVGDSLTSDIQGGVNFGIDTCWYNPERATAPARPVPNHIISTLEELIPLCLRSTGGSSRT